MTAWLIYVLLCLALAAFCCLFAYEPGKDDHISGDWRRWGFEDDPLAPEPTPDGELVGK
jgi:hypothetical protein